MPAAYIQGRRGETDISGAGETAKSTICATGRTKTRFQPLHTFAGTFGPKFNKINICFNSSLRYTMPKHKHSCGFAGLIGFRGPEHAPRGLLFVLFPDSLGQYEQRSNRVGGGKMGVRFHPRRRCICRTSTQRPHKVYIILMRRRKPRENTAFSLHNTTKQARRKSGSTQTQTGVAENKGTGEKCGSGH